MPWFSLRRGQLAGIASAVLFRCSSSLISTLTVAGTALSIAGLLYGGATLALLTVRLLRGTQEAETPVGRQDWPVLAAVTLLGGVVGPLALVMGLARLPAASSSLLLNLEAVFTLVIAVLLGSVHLRRRGLLSAGLTITGTVVPRGLPCWGQRGRRCSDCPGNPGLGHRQQPQPAVEPAQSDPDRHLESGRGLVADARSGPPAWAQACPACQLAWGYLRSVPWVTASRAGSTCWPCAISAPPAKRCCSPPLPSWAR